MRAFRSPRMDWLRDLSTSTDWLSRRKSAALRENSSFSYLDAPPARAQSHISECAGGGACKAIPRLHSETGASECEGNAGARCSGCT